MPYAWLKDGTPLHYIEQGNGTPVVLLNALMYSARYFWRHNIGPLSQGARVIALDPRGHGESGKPNFGYTVAGLADDLAEFLAAKQLRGVVLAGVALSGFVILDLLRRHGADGIKGIALCEMTPRLVSAPGWDHPTFGNFPPEAAAAFGAGVRADKSRAGLRNFFMAGYAVPPDEATLAEIMSETWLMPTDAIADLCDEMVRQDVREQLKSIPVPTLYMYGGPKNNLLPTRPGAWVHAQTPGSQLVEFMDSGHNPFLEEPKKFNASLLAFVNSLGRG
jgi:pimeloyl-ACP methyl ester carboxylesterase